MAATKELKTRYQEELIANIKKDLGIDNIMALPKITKVVVNVGIGTYTKQHGKDYSQVVESLKLITGQQPAIRRATKSVSNFKIREGDVVGLSVTLRGERMYHFIDKLVNIVFPRVRDFRGISPKSFDGRGNYSIGFKEHTVFPEISPDDVTRLHGIQVNIATSADNNEDAHKVLKAFGFPFKQTN